MGSEDWSDGVLERWVRKCITPRLHYSNPGAVIEQSKLTIATVLIAFNLLLVSTAVAEEVFVGNPGKSLNFFHFDLAIERGFFKELGLDVKLLSTKCDIAVTALLTGDLLGIEVRGCRHSHRSRRRGSHCVLRTQIRYTNVNTRIQIRSTKCQ